MIYPKIISKADMAERWGVSRQVVNNWESRHKNFPKPITTVHGGKLPVYSLDNVIKYEENKRGEIK